jgi:pimeloyl-ACP methyl ester carboxylesterase
MSKPIHRRIPTNGIHLHVAEQGEGPLVLLLHGFPESWFSYRHQLSALADAGYRAVAPDLRGFGDSDRPHAVEAYDQIELAADVAGLIDAYGGEPAVVVGHDWGAPVAWHSALLHRDKVRAVVGMSVPYGGRSPHAPLPRMRELFKDIFFYMLYFQEEGVAEAELEANVRESLRQFYLSISGDVPADAAFKVYPPSSRLFETLYDDGRVPSFLCEADLDVYAAQYERSGFRGPLNLYRNFDRTWQRLAAVPSFTLSQPALFIAGDRDPVIAFSAKQLSRMPTLVPHLQRTLLVPGAGHWIQQERPELTNQALLEFLESIKP